MPDGDLFVQLNHLISVTLVSTNKSVEGLADSSYNVPVSRHRSIMPRKIATPMGDFSFAFFACLLDHVNAVLMLQLRSRQRESTDHVADDRATPARRAGRTRNPSSTASRRPRLVILSSAMLIIKFMIFSQQLRSAFSRNRISQ